MWAQRRRTGVARQWQARGRLTPIVATSSSRRPLAAAHSAVHGSSGGNSRQRDDAGTGRGSSGASSRPLSGDRGSDSAARRASADTGRPTQTPQGGRGGSAAQQNGGRGGDSSAAQRHSGRGGDSSAAQQNGGRGGDSSVTRQQANLDLLLSLGQQFTRESLPWIRDLLVPLLTLGRPAPPLTGMNKLGCELLNCSTLQCKILP